MNAQSRIVVIAPPSIEAAIVSRLKRSRQSPVIDPADAHADALVFVPHGPTRSGALDSIRTAFNALSAAALDRIEQVVVVSSAAIYGASPYTPGFVDEAWEPPPTHPNSVAAWWREFERHAAQTFQPRAIAILRPSPLLDGEGYFSKLFHGAVAVTLSGHDPSIQLLALDDLAAAVESAISRRATGIFNVAPRGVVPLRAALRLARRRRLPLPRLWQRTGRAVLAPTGVAYSADQLEFIRYPSTISGDRIARELGFTPTRSSAGALARFLNGAAQSESDRDREPEFDPFGQDKRYIDAYGRTLFTFLSAYYWRIESEGADCVPAAGRAVLVGPHRGFMPFDGVMLLHLVARARRRYVRFLIHPSLVKFPFLFNFMTKLGGIPACRQNADWILQHDEIAGVFPEGIHGAFTPYRDAYRLGKFGRDEFVRMAIRNRAPIAPFATVGSAEIFPILAKIRWPWWERWTDWPFFPITPTFPLAPVPLPSKWHVRFLPAIHVEDQYPPEAADDRRAVVEVSQLVRAQIQAAMDEMVSRRRWIFFGSIFDRGSRGAV